MDGVHPTNIYHRCTNNCVFVLEYEYQVPNIGQKYQCRKNWQKENYLNSCTIESYNSVRIRLTWFLD